MKKIISTSKAPQAIGSYSQAVKAGNLVFASGQIALHPETGEMVNSNFIEEATRVFENVKAIAEAANGDLSNIVKLTIYLTDLGDFAKLNEVMSEIFNEPFPARAAVEVSKLPRDATIEVDAILQIS